MRTSVRGLKPTLRVLKWAALVGFAELRTIYTWRTWVFGWLLRVITQVVFFALLGTLVGSHEREQYLLIGNAVMIACLEASAVIASTTTERMSGTLPLLLATPHGHVTSMLGRGVHWLCTGIASSTISLGVSALLFGVRLPWPAVLWVPPLTLLAALSTYALGTFVGAFAMWIPELSLTIMNATYMSIMTFCGVMVPVSFWPPWVQTIAEGLPVTHGLAAVRAVLAGDSARFVSGQAALEALVGGCWLLAAVLSYRQLARLARQSGAVEFEA